MGFGWRDLAKMTPNDEVCGHVTSDYEHFQRTQNSMDNHMYNKSELEAIKNESHQNDFKRLQHRIWPRQDSQPRRASYYVRSLTRLTGCPIHRWSDWHLLCLCGSGQALARHNPRMHESYSTQEPAAVLLVIDW